MSMHGRNRFVGFDQVTWTSPSYEPLVMAWVSFAGNRLIVLSHEGKPVYITEAKTPAADAVAYSKFWQDIARKEYNEPSRVIEDQDEFFAYIEERVKQVTIEYITARMG